MRWLRDQLAGMSLSRRIKAMMVVIMAIIGVLVMFTLGMLLRYQSQYDTIITNFTAASQFKNDFREEIDAAAYWYVAGRDDFSEKDPYGQIEAARAVIDELEENTTYPASLSQLRRINRLIDSLENGFAELAEGPPTDRGLYDWGMERLEKKVYRLTGMIEESMLQYIFNETVYLAELHAGLTATVRSSIIMVVIISALVLGLLFLFSMRMAGSITKPLRELNENIRLVGEGDFTVRPIQTGNNEVQTISDTLDGMVERIVVLMDNIRLEQENLRRTELELLQSQINPHFLYNAFDTVIWLAEDDQSGQVVKTVESLSNFFRTSLSKGRNFIPVREEMLHVRSYLEIQHTRYSDILEYDIECPEEIYDFVVQKLTLQPLVENALYHGIKNRRGLGKIIVKGEKVGERLVFEVYDNGMGIEPKELEALRNSLQGQRKSGYGMANVQERIQLHYGKEYGLSIESEYGKFTRVRVELPAQISEPNS